MAEKNTNAAAKSQGQQHLDNLLRTHNRVRDLRAEIVRLKATVGVPKARAPAPAADKPADDKRGRDVPFFEALGRLNGNLDDLVTEIEHQVDDLKGSF